MLRPDHIEILQYVKRKRNPAGWVERRSADRPGVWGGLVRKGLLRTARQGQNPIHEPASWWTIYYLTDAGLAALAAGGEKQDG